MKTCEYFKLSVSIPEILQRTCITAKLVMAFMSHCGSPFNRNWKQAWTNSLSMNVARCSQGDGRAKSCWNVFRISPCVWKLFCRVISQNAEVLSVRAALHAADCRWAKSVFSQLFRRISTFNALFYTVNETSTQYLKPVSSPEKDY